MQILDWFVLETWMVWAAIVGFFALVAGICWLEHRIEKLAKRVEALERAA